jgi:hypothetical protein
MPLLQVAYHAYPAALTALLEDLLIVTRAARLKQEDLYQGALLPCRSVYAVLAEMQTGLYHLRVIIDKETPLWEIARYVLELVMTDGSLVIYQQLALLAMCKGILGYTLVRERIVIVLYLYVGNRRGQIDELTN